MEKIPNIHKVREIMYPENKAEIYTLQDMMADMVIEQDDQPSAGEFLQALRTDDEDEMIGDNPIDDALFHKYRGSDILHDVDEKQRLIEITVDADAILTVEAIKNYGQELSDIVQQLGAGRVQFVGIQGGVDMRIGLVFRY